MFTSIGFVVIFAVTPQSPNGKQAVDDGIVWQKDYYAAQLQGTQEKKPLAVFVSSGGHRKLVQDGRWPKALKDTLASKYICVCLDNEKTGDRELIRALAISTGQGLVISDRTGNLQAFHHDGAITPADLARHLQTFAEPGAQVRTTTTNGQQRVSYYPSAGYGRPTTFVPATSFRNC
ncbi:MAG: hypothetical protein L0215_00730 [Gemmataceae bacterium]|nr:hypothetical protein [Gemmataceae bacterium]